MSTITGMQRKGPSYVIEYNGFENQTDTNISFSDSSPDRTFTISPSVLSFTYYSDGSRYVKQSSKTIQIPDTEGVHAIYYDGNALTTSTNLTNSIIENLILNKAIIAYVYWDADNNKGKLFEERHLINMSSYTRRELHFTIGTRYFDGLAIGDILADQNGSLDSHAQFSVATGQIFDEDIKHVTNTINSTTGLEVWHRNSNLDWRWDTQSGFSVLNAPGGRLYYDNNGTLTEITDGKYVLYHVFAWNSTDGNPISIMGQNEYNSIAAARDGATTEINSISISGFLPSQEMKPIGSIIFQTRDVYTNSVKARIISTDEGDTYVDWRIGELSPSSAAQDHGSLAGLFDDDHPGHPWLNGRSGGQTLIGGINASDNLTLQSTSNTTRGNIIASDDFKGGNIFTGIESISGNLSSTIHTGLISGGLLSINADNTKFDISAGTGIIVTRSDKNDITITPISWDDITGITPDNITSAAGEFIGINSNGDVVMSILDFTPDELTTIIRLGRISHFNRTIIDRVYTYRVYYNTDLDLINFVNQFGTTNLSGNVISANGANMSIDKSQGICYRIGANLETNPENPNFPTTPSASPITILRAYRDGSGNTTIAGTYTTLDPNYYDDGSGTLQTVGNNKYTIQTVLFFPNNTIYTIFVLYGQEEFPNYDAAYSALSTYSPTIEDDLSGGNFRAFIILEKGETDLAAAIAAENAFIQEGVIFDAKGGGGSGGATAGGTPNFQSVYNVSTTAPQITTDATNGCLQIKNGSGSDSNTTQCWLNNSGAITAKIIGDGDLTIRSVYVSDGGVIGQLAGPLLAFDDTNDYLGITGCYVGMGTNTPISELHIVGSGGTQLTIEGSGISTGGLLQNASGLLVASEDDILFRIGVTWDGDWTATGTEIARIDSTGLGIGTSPSYALHAKPLSTTGAVAMFTGNPWTTTGNTSTIYLGDTSHYVQAKYGGPFRISSSDPLHISMSNFNYLSGVLDINSSSQCRLSMKGAGDGSNFSSIDLYSDEATDKVWGITHSQGVLNHLQMLYYDGASWYPYVDIDATGAMTRPYHPAFLADLVSSYPANITGNGTFYTVVFTTERYDLNSDYNTSTGIFTAPVTGRYAFDVGVGLVGVTGASHLLMQLVTSNKTYTIFNAAGLTGDFIQMQGSVQADMDASDTAYVKILVNGLGADTADFHGYNDLHWFSGHLIC